MRIFLISTKIKGLSSEINFSTSDIISIRWSAPELLNGQKPSFKTDVFAFAITVHEIFNQGKLPYWELKSVEVQHFVKSGNRMTISDKLTKEIRKLIKQCWDQDPERRPNFGAISKTVTEAYDSAN